MKRAALESVYKQCREGLTLNNIRFSNLARREAGSLLEMIFTLFNLKIVMFSRGCQSFLGALRL